MNNVFDIDFTTENLKKCSHCKIVKSLSEFGKANKGRQCKLCYRKWRNNYYKKDYVKKKERVHFLKNYFKRVYGITLDEYNKMLIDQNGVCKICKSSWARINPKTKKPEQLCVDHCHKTKKVRGLLCSKCNSAIALLDDDISKLESAIIYLKDNISCF